MVQERRVLLGVEHLEERTRRIAIVSTTDLVNLVDKHKRVLGTDAFQCLDDLSGERSKHDHLSVNRLRGQDKHKYIPDIGTPVTLDLRDICQTTDRETEELPIERASDRLANGRLSHARRTNETDDLAFDRTAELANREELEDTILDVLETVVILVKNLLRVSDRVVLAGVLTPRNLEQLSSTRHLLEIVEWECIPE